MARARHALGALAWGAMVAATLLWWSPSFLLAVARWQGGRLRFAAMMVLGRALVALGWPGAASRVYGAPLALAERQRREMIRRRRTIL